MNFFKPLADILSALGNLRYESLYRIAEIYFSHSIQNVLQNFWMQIFLGLIVTKCNQSVQVFSCMRNETGMKILAHGMHMQALCMYM